MTNKSIKISNLSKTYRDNGSPALNNFNLEIKTGEIFGVLGPNGAGKTTLFSILCGMLDATSGSAQLCGLDIDVEREKIKKLFGIVPQDIALYPTISCLENLLFIGRMYGMKEQRLRAKIDYYIDLFNISTFLHKPIKACSGGTKRKINLIGGLLHEPKILLLDEPTVGVDVQTRNSIMSYLKLINQKEKTTILYTSHYLEQAQSFCDRIGILDEGKLIIVDTPEKLMQQENTQNLEQVFLKLTQKESHSQ